MMVTMDKETKMLSEEQALNLIESLDKAKFVCVGGAFYAVHQILYVKPILKETHFQIDEPI